MNTTPNVMQTARRYIQAGISIIPIKRDGSKRPPLKEWNPYRERLATEVELCAWFGRKAPFGIATVCGAVSGNLEVIDFDEEADTNFPQWCALVEAEAPGLVAKLSIVKTPRQPSGFHLRYRTGGITPVTTKLAMHEDGKVTLIEARGEGAYAVAPGSPSECHKNAARYEHTDGTVPAWDPPTITAAEREILCRCAASFDRQKDEVGHAFKPQTSGAVLPGDDYCVRGPDWSEILTGWELVRQTDLCCYWRRPGKDGKDWSATTGRCKNQKGHDLLAVFSTSTDHFPGPHGGKQCSVHTKFQAYALIHHGGDFKVAAKVLRGLGYGSQVDSNERDGGKAERPADIVAKQLGVTPVIVSLADVRPESIKWLWYGRIALGKVTLIAGDPGLGKSFVTLDIAARVSSGASWPDAPAIKITAGGVVLLSAEDDVADTIRPRLDAAGADVRRIISLQAVRRNYKDGPAKESTFCLETDLVALEAAILAVPGCRLVIIDPITAYLGATDSHKNAEIRALLAPLAALAAKYGVAIVCVTHLNKSANGPAIYRAIGSIAFAAAARAVWAVTKDKDNPRRRLMLPAKNNLAPDALGLAYSLEPYGTNGTAVVCWETDPVTTSADEAMQGEASKSDAKDGYQAQSWLREALKDGPMPAKAVLDQGKANGFTNKVIRCAFHDLKGQRKKIGFTEGWLWWLPTAEDAEVAVLPPKESSEPSQKTEESSAIFNPEIAKIPLQQDAESSDADEGDWGVVA